MATDQEISDLINAIKTEVYSTNPDAERLASFKNALSTVIGTVIVGQKYTVTYDDFKPSGSLVNTFEIGQSLPGAIPIHYKIKPSIAFAAENLVSASLVLVDGNDHELSDACNMLLVGDRKGKYGGIHASSDLLSETEPEALNAKLTLVSPTTAILTITAEMDITSWTDSIRANNGALATVDSVTLVGVDTYELVLSSLTGNWAAATSVDDNEAGNGFTGIVTNFEEITGSTIDDLTAGEVDIWIWFLVKI